MAVEANLESNIKSLSNAVTSFFLPGIPIAAYQSLENLLDFIDTRADEKVIDEYPYLAEVYPAFSSLLQKHLNEKGKH